MFSKTAKMKVGWSNMLKINDQSGLINVNKARKLN